jgi:hypothetical protein
MYRLVNRQRRRHVNQPGSPAASLHESSEFLTAREAVALPATDREL